MLRYASTTGRCFWANRYVVGVYERPVFLPVDGGSMRQNTSKTSNSEVPLYEATIDRHLLMVNLAPRLALGRLRVALSRPAFCFGGTLPSRRTGVYVFSAALTHCRNSCLAGQARRGGPPVPEMYRDRGENVRLRPPTACAKPQHQGGLLARTGKVVAVASTTNPWANVAATYT